MKPKTFLFIMALAGIIVSCIPSLYPLYREKDLMVNDKLEGIFGDFDGIFGEDDDDYWEIRRLGPDIVKDLKGDWQQYQSGYTYRLSVMEDGEMEEFAMHLMKLGEDLYLDFFPVGYSIKPGFLEMHLAPSHIFAKTEISDEYLVLHFFEMDWLEELLVENRIKISHMKLQDNRYLLTAKTE
ncbi:MAG: hypothetical protein KAT15_05690, partial [Bacteroidales bacterium]|nr:hypothetical protein [Bacteroidales bacterium]